jgi:MFS family permease
MRLWSADAISQVGSQVTLLALPFAAILVLHASAFELGVLSACASLPFLLIGLPAGVWVDRLRRRPIMVVADAGRAALLASVPLTDALGALTLGQLYAVAFGAGILTVFFDVSYQSYLPTLVDRDRLMEGNAKLEIARSGGRIAGPALGGALVQALTAPLAILVDGASFVASALLLGRIRRAEPAPRPSGSRVIGGLRREIAEGLRHVLRHPLLRPQATSTAVFNFFSAAFDAVFLLYAKTELGLSAGAIGGVMAAGACAIPVSALLVGRMTAGVGLGRTIALGTILGAAGFLLVTAAPRGAAVPLLIVGFVLVSTGIVLYNVSQISLRQAITPDRLLGRTNATMRFIVWGTLPLGALVGGVIGGTAGLRPTLWTSALGSVLAIVPIVLSPVGRLRTVPPGAQGS